MFQPISHYFTQHRLDATQNLANCSLTLLEQLEESAFSEILAISTILETRLPTDLLIMAALQVLDEITLPSPCLQLEMGDILVERVNTDLYFLGLFIN